MISNGLRDTKQVRSLKHREKKKAQEKGNGTRPKLNNFADHIQYVETQLDNHPFVRQNIKTPRKVPVMILYTEDQMTCTAMQMNAHTSHSSNICP